MFNTNGMPSLSDIAAITKDDGMGNGSWIWFFLIIILLFGNNFGGNNLGNGNIVYGDTPATTTEVYSAVNQQSITQKLNEIQNGITASTYETAGLVNNNANMINSTLNSGFSGLSNQICELGHSMQECCCNLKQMIMENRYADVHDQLQLSQIVASNATQTQNILNTTGHWVPYPTPYYGTTTA